jgi:hypothetical protein
MLRCSIYYVCMYLLLLKIDSSNYFLKLDLIRLYKIINQISNKTFYYKSKYKIKMRRKKMDINLEFGKPR